MKKLISIISCLLILSILVGCDEKTDESFLSLNKNIEELSYKFDYELGKCLLDNIAIEYSIFNRGEKVHIKDEDDDFYYIDYKTLTLAIDKRFIRNENEEEFKVYEAYTRNRSNMYADIQCQGKINSFSLNDVVKVLDSFYDLLLVEYEGKIGYMYPSQVSKSKIQIYVAPPVETPSSNSGGSSSSGGGGGNSNPIPSNPNPPASSGDGEDIQLAYKSYGYRIVNLTGYTQMDGLVLADNTKAYITKLNRDDVIKILEENEDLYTILINGHQGKIKKLYVRKDSEQSYEQWQGYSKSGVGIYGDYLLDNRISYCSINEKIYVIDEVDGVYVIKLENGEIAYMSSSSVSKEKNKVYVAPPVEVPSYSGGGSSSSGGGGGNYNPSPKPEPVQEWTDPVL